MPWIISFTNYVYMYDINILCVKKFQGFNGADLRNICTEAGMSAIRAERDYVIHEDFMKVSSVQETIFPWYLLIILQRGVPLLVSYNYFCTGC